MKGFLNALRCLEWVYRVESAVHVAGSASRSASYSLEREVVVDVLLAVKGVPGPPDGTYHGVSEVRRWWPPPRGVVVPEHFL